MISSRKEIGEYSNESILTALRTPGGVADGGRVLIERGCGKKKAKFFTFGAAHDGAVMPEALIKEAPLTILTTVYYMHLHMHYCILYSIDILLGCRNSRLELKTKSKSRISIPHGSCLIRFELGASARATLHFAHLLFRLPWGQGVHTAQPSFRLP